MPQGTPQQTESMVSMIMMLVLMFAIFYFFLIRPQRKKEKKLQNMIANLKVGDVVSSIGGIHGKIIRIKDDAFVLESGMGTNKSYITIDRAAISRLIKEGSSKANEVAPIPDDEPEETETKAE